MARLGMLLGACKNSSEVFIMVYLHFGSCVDNGVLSCVPFVANSFPQKTKNKKALHKYTGP